MRCMITPRRASERNLRPLLAAAFRHLHGPCLQPRSPRRSREYAVGGGVECRSGQRCRNGARRSQAMFELFAMAEIRLSLRPRSAGLRGIGQYEACWMAWMVGPLPVRGGQIGCVAQSWRRSEMQTSAAREGGTPRGPSGEGCIGRRVARMFGMHVAQVAPFGVCPTEYRWILTWHINTWYEYPHRVENPTCSTKHDILSAIWVYSDTFVNTPPHERWPPSGASTP